MLSLSLHPTSRLAAVAVLLSAAGALGQDAGGAGSEILVLGDRSIV